MRQLLRCSICEGRITFRDENMKAGLPELGCPAFSWE